MRSLVGASFLTRVGATIFDDRCGLPDESRCSTGCAHRCDCTDKNRARTNAHLLGTDKHPRRTHEHPRRTDEHPRRTDKRQETGTDTDALRMVDFILAGGRING